MSFPDCKGRSCRLEGIKEKRGGEVMEEGKEGGGRKEEGREGKRFEEGGLQEALVKMRRKGSRYKMLRTTLHSRNRYVRAKERGRKGREEKGMEVKRKVGRKEEVRERVKREGQAALKSCRGSSRYREDVRPPCARAIRNKKAKGEGRRGRKKLSSLCRLNSVPSTTHSLSEPPRERIRTFGAFKYSQRVWVLGGFGNFLRKGLTR